MAMKIPTKSKLEAARRPKPAAAGKASTPARKTSAAAARAASLAFRSKLAAVTLRIPVGVLARVDRSVSARRAKNPIPRTTWLLDAVNEKLAHEEQEEDDE